MYQLEVASSREHSAFFQDSEFGLPVLIQVYVSSVFNGKTQQIQTQQFHNTKKLQAFLTVSRSHKAERFQLFLKSFCIYIYISYHLLAVQAQSCLPYSQFSKMLMPMLFPRYEYICWIKIVSYSFIKTNTLLSDAYTPSIGSYYEKLAILVYLLSNWPIFFTCPLIYLLGKFSNKQLKKAVQSHERHMRGLCHVRKSLLDMEFQHSSFGKFVIT